MLPNPPIETCRMPMTESGLALIWHCRRSRHTTRESAKTSCSKSGSLRGCAKLLAGAADFYERLEGLLKNQADRRSRAALGQAYHEMGELTAKIGSHSEALAALSAASSCGDGWLSNQNRTAAQSSISPRV